MSEIVTAPFSRLSSAVPSRVVLALALSVAASGCHREEVPFYRVAKGDVDAADVAPAASSAAADSSSDSRVHWTVPAGWKTKPATQMRVGNFIAESPDGRVAEITVIPFPGQAGGEVDNVNRWRGQIKLPPVTAAEITSQTISIGGNQAKLYDMTSAEPIPPSQRKTRVIAASALVDGNSWFFKLTGDEDLASAQRPAFAQFLKSVAFGSSPLAAAIPSTPAPPSASPVVPATATPTAPATSATGNTAPTTASPQWDLPKDWQPLPTNAMKVGNFSITEGDASAVVTVTTFPGDVGGSLANVNRWRGQIGLNPVAESDLGALLSPLDVDGGKAMLIDMTGQGQEAGKKVRLIAVSLRKGENSWFFKIIGDEPVVAKQRAGFIHFVQSTRLPNG